MQALDSILILLLKSSLHAEKVDNTGIVMTIQRSIISNLARPRQFMTQASLRIAAKNIDIGTTLR
jgi:hypothetical protein